ncbi:MAG: 16S rRNA (cytosine(1402)-N(4))-methyltransferase RsmH [Phycisphaerales bacterium]|jgi:16S rRNA (cytosine1402-N4)-methyltransferase|nr:16S rRNA (cytosine(1402)-N(4))-methyltransferase RsmH [Phycisphaerales bacterium]|tara:strand:- start:2539 stop:3465 length:927 start_codon:yes stop_codon:yes gene_type:complete
MPDSGHIPVLPIDVAETLRPSTGNVIVDCTAGRGGHAAQLARIAKSEATVILFDLDKENLNYATTRVEETGATVHAFHASFVTAASSVTALGLQADCVLADLGFASNQMDDMGRGLSFKGGGPLDMRLNTDSGMKAQDILETYGEEELANLIYELGEEPYSRRIARKIVLERQKEPILDTARLAQIVRSAYGARARTSRMHPATRTFMALRIAVNNELEALDHLLQDVELGCRTANDGGWLKQGARVTVISFHSLEDRRVKHAFVGLEKNGLGTRITRKPICASDEEIARNPRSRPAKLRALHLLQED